MHKLYTKFLVSYYLQWCRNRGGQGGHWPPQYFADQLTLFETGRADYPNLLLLAPQCFSPSGITDSCTKFAMYSEINIGQGINLARIKGEPWIIVGHQNFTSFLHQSRHCGFFFDLFSPKFPKFDQRTWKQFWWKFYSLFQTKKGVLGVF